MSWSSVTTWTQKTGIAGTESFFDPVTLNPGESAHVTIESDASGTNDELTVNFYGRVDGTNWDDTPFFSQNIGNNSGNPNQVSFIISGVYEFRIGVVRDGSTDTFTVDGEYRKDGVSL